MFSKVNYSKHEADKEEYLFASIDKMSERDKDMRKLHPISYLTLTDFVFSALD